MTPCAHAIAIPSLTPLGRHQVVQGVIEQLTTYYVFADKAVDAGEFLRTQLANGAYDARTDPAGFAERLTSDIQSVIGDKHVRVRLRGTGLEPEVSDAVSHDAALERYRRQAEARNHGVARVEQLPLNIGCLDLRIFDVAAFAGESIAAAMTLVAHSRALIVDLRQCVGGDPATVALACSYLFDERTHLNSIYRRESDSTDQYWSLDWVPGKRFGQHKPVCVLTSERTFSAAEEFAYNLQSHRRATLVDRSTKGGAHPGGPRRVNQHFEVFVPDARSVSPITNANWEGTGVTPDIDVPEHDALRVAQLHMQQAFAAQPGCTDVTAIAARIAELDALCDPGS